MTQVEKRGIAGAYKKGCGCEVRNFNGNLIFKYFNLFNLADKSLHEQHWM